VFENSLSQKNRSDPKRRQLGNCEFVEVDRCADVERVQGMTVITGGDEGDGARVFYLICIGVNALVQLRRDAEGQRPEKRGETEGRDKSTDRRAVSHLARIF